MIVLLFGYGPKGSVWPDNAVEKALDEKGVEWNYLDLYNLPGTTVGVHLNHGELDGWLDFGSKRVRFQEIGAVWLPYAAPWVSSPSLDPDSQRFAEDEWRAYLHGFFLLTRDRLWVNPPDAALETNSKAFQLRLAQSLGFDTPDTLIGTSETDLRAFMATHGSRAIAKRLSAEWSTFPRAGGRDSVLSHLLTVEELDSAKSGALKWCPSIFQEYLAKLSEFRVYVIGARVFPFEILSQSDDRTKVDWRNYPLKEGPMGAEIDYDRWRCRAATLPAITERLCLELARALGLRYTAIDIVKTTEGRYIFLEANYGGAFYFIEKVTSTPLSVAIADLLSDAL